MRTYDELAKLYPSINEIDAEFGTVMGMDGEPQQLDYEAGCISEDITNADKERRLVTMIDDDNGEVCFCIGLCFVNRITYYMTERPMPEDLYESRLCVAT